MECNGIACPPRSSQTSTLSQRPSLLLYYLLRGCKWIRESSAAEAVVVFVVLPTITYPVIGEELNSSIMVDMIRFSADIIAVLSLRLQFMIEGFSPVMSKDDL
jgi:hypothetical protein